MKLSKLQEHLYYGRGNRGCVSQDTVCYKESFQLEKVLILRTFSHEMLIKNSRVIRHRFDFEMQMWLKILYSEVVIHDQILLHELFIGCGDIYAC